MSTNELTVHNQARVVAQLAYVVVSVPSSNPAQTINLLSVLFTSYCISLLPYSVLVLRTVHWTMGNDRKR